jgi:DUF4097 and DUF4098 domain-containing protein YvlB
VKDREEVKRILQMVKDGKITPEDAAELIEAFEAGEAADATSTSSPKEEKSEPQSSSTDDGFKDPFKSFVETLERISKEATGSVNWQEVGKHVQDSARKGVEALKTGLDQVSKGKVAFPWGGIQETKEITLPLTIPAGKTLKVDNACGDVKIVGGFEKGSATAHARFRSSSTEDAKAKAEAYTLIIEESDHMILIRQPDVIGLSVDVEIQMPGKAPVEIRSSSGDISVMDTGGSLRIDGASGDIRAKGLNGPVEISSASGNVVVEDVWTPSMTIENKAGDVLLKSIKGNINARTSAGDVALNDFSGKTVSIESVSGDVKVDLAEPVTGTVNLRTVSGNARVTMDGGDCRVSLSTLRGAVACDVPLTEENRTAQRVTGKVGDGSGTLDVSAVTGNVSVSLRDHKA